MEYKLTNSEFLLFTGSFSDSGTVITWCSWNRCLKIIMIDWDQRPPLKSASTDVIISNDGLIKGYSQIGFLSKFSDQWPIYWLGHTSVTSLDINLRKWETSIDFRIGHRFENWKKNIDLRTGRRFKNLKKKDIDLRYRCLWLWNRT
jgi:hypothetical protein